MSRASFPLVLIFAQLLFVSVVAAQDAEPVIGEASDPVATPAAEPATAPTPAEAAAAPAASNSDLPTAQADDGSMESAHEPAVQEQHRSGADPYEDPQETYFFLGGFYRHTWMPSWMTELFVQTAPDINNPQFGLDFSVRKDHFEVIYSLWYADYSAYGPFLGANDEPNEMEMIDSQLWAAMAGVTFLWSSEFSDWFAIEYGLGLGAGYVGGDLYRTEAYPTQGGGWDACTGPTTPGTPGTADGAPFEGTYDPAYSTSSDWCGIPASGLTDADGDEGNHYNVRARTWTQGGSVPNVWFRAALQLSLRFKPIAQLVIRADGGFDIFSGFFLGGAVQFGF